MPVTYVADIQPLFRPRDVGAMKRFGPFDLSKYEDVVTNADGILTRLKDGDMPCDGGWAPEKIALFEQWISDGKLENPPPPQGPQASAIAARPTAAPKKRTAVKKKKTTKTTRTKKKTIKKTKKKTRARRG